MAAAALAVLKADLEAKYGKGCIVYGDLDSLMVMLPQGTVLTGNDTLYPLGESDDGTTDASEGLPSDGASRRLSGAHLCGSFNGSAE